MSRSLPVRRDLPALGMILVAVIAAMLIASRATLPEIPGWYASLIKPSWTPPNWLFGPVWTVLYLLMATAAWLVWRQRRHLAVQAALILWSIQLALNLAWSLLFFAGHAIELALVDIVLLLGAIVGTILLFLPIRRLAALLMLPYLAWSLYAASLNAGIVALN